MNPLVNAGAITATSMVQGGTYAEIWNSIIGYYSEFSGRTLSVNQDVYVSESPNNQRNQAIAQLMFAYGRIKSNPARATDIYTNQCAVSVNAKDLAVMAAALANVGRNPLTKRQVMRMEDVSEVLAVMATAGLYDESDTAGNSVRAQKTITDVSNALGGNPYARSRSSRVEGPGQEGLPPQSRAH